MSESLSPGDAKAVRGLWASAGWEAVRVEKWRNEWPGSLLAFRFVASREAVDAAEISWAAFAETSPKKVAGRETVLFRNWWGISETRSFDRP